MVLSETAQSSFSIVILFRFLAQPMDNLYRKHKLGIELAWSLGQLGTEEIQIQKSVKN